MTSQDEARLNFPIQVEIGQVLDVMGTLFRVETFTVEYNEAPYLMVEPVIKELTLPVVVARASSAWEIKCPLCDKVFNSHNSITKNRTMMLEHNEQKHSDKEKS